MLVDNQIPLFNGVSQQPAEARLDTQCEVMNNCYPTIANGIVRRNPLEHRYFDNEVPEDAFVHSYTNKDDGNTYFIVLGNGIWRTYKDNGTGVSLIDEASSVDYLDIGSAKPSESFSAVTVADTTFLVNKTKEVAMSGTPDTSNLDWDKELFYWVKRTAGADDETNGPLRYTYYLRSDDPSYVGISQHNNTTGDLVDFTASWGINTLVGLWVTNITQGWSCEIESNTDVSINTDCNNKTWNIGDEYEITVQNTGHDSNKIVSELSKQIKGTQDPSYTADSSGSVLKVTINDTYKLEGSDSWGNQASESWQGKVKKLQDLPNELGFEGTIIEISGDEDNNFDNYYVQYQDGVYLETVRPGLDNTIDNSTMPHKLVIGIDPDDGILKSIYSAIEWDNRKKGDEDSAPIPSFIGGTLSDIFFFKNRLGLLSKDNIILSEIGSYYNFFPTTTTSVLDSSPIDVAIDSNEYVNLRYALPFNKDLLLFGDNQQFILSGEEALTPEKISVQQSTAYAINSKAKPIGMGGSVFFTSDTNNYSIVREYLVGVDSQTETAADISSHVPRYIPKGVVKITGSNRQNMLFALSKEEQDTIYVYNYLWSTNKKAQSAWHKWTIDGTNIDIFNIEVVESYLMVMYTENGSRQMGQIDLEIPGDIASINYEDTHYNNRLNDVDSLLTLSRFGISSTDLKIDNIRGKLLLKDIQFSAEENSYYQVQIDSPRRSRTYSRKRNDKYMLSGSTDNTTVHLKNSSKDGFKINLASYKVGYNKTTRSV